MRRTPRGRREALRVLATSLLAGAGVTALGPSGGCQRAPSPKPAPPPSAGGHVPGAGAAPASASRARLRVPLEGVPAGQRTVLPYGDAFVELQRDDDEVTARLLLCTHFGCPVAWDEEKGRYACPCHAGAFDAAGAPIAGPPTRPLLTVPTRRAGDVLVVGGDEG